MSFEHLGRVFHTALVATKVSKASNCSDRLASLVRTPAFAAILDAVKNLAAQQGIPEERAAEELIHAFRGIDQVWSEYLCKEGLENLKKHISQ